MPQKRHNLRRPRAVTVLEMVVAMSIMAIVMAAVLPLFAGIRNNWDTRQANAEIVQNARVLADHLHRTLATAIRITDVSPSAQENGFIEFTANDGALYRYAVGQDGYVQFGPSGEPGDLAGPVSRFQFTCYDGNDFTTPTVEASSVRFVAVQTTFANEVPTGADKTFTTQVYIRAGTLDSDDSEPDDGFSPGVAVRNSIAWGGRNICIDSYRSSGGPYDPMQPGAEAVVSVNAIGTNVITLWSSAVIRGDAYIGPGGNPTTGIATWGASQITGRRESLTSAVEIPALSAPTGSPFNGAPERAFELSGRQTQTIDSDRHIERIGLWGSSVLTIEGHVTVLLRQGLQTSSRAELRIPPNSSLTLYVGDGVEISGSSVLNGIGADPSRLRINMIGNGKSFQMSSNTVACAVLQNPQGSVSIWSQSEFFGKIRAGSLEGGGRIHIDLDCDFENGSR
ncbi:PilW family protein [Anaerobaca lacustris]|uniref:Type II secretion system protein n=1 Tax=Anaerobaca lacustris TaxID=3044600 RepID=A0AAW6U638_9BACT|nr:type II secretion system protein [Sedimentisphaerales bacterium M17dextr]